MITRRIDGVWRAVEGKKPKIPLIPRDDFGERVIAARPRRGWGYEGQNKHKKNYKTKTQETA
jgi:hypothetical protein